MSSALPNLLSLKEKAMHPAMAKIQVAPYQLWQLTQDRGVVEVMSYPSEGKIYARTLPGLASTAVWFNVDELYFKLPKLRYVAYGLATPKGIVTSFPDDMIRYMGHASKGEFTGKGWEIANVGRSKGKAMDFIEGRWQSFGWTVKLTNVKDLWNDEGVSL
jgi:hypothetical protein